MTALQVLSALSLLAFAVPVAFAFKFWRERNHAIAEVRWLDNEIRIERDWTRWYKEVALDNCPNLKDWMSPDDLEQWDWA